MEDKQRLEKIGTLLEALREAQAKTYEITEELQALAGGGDSYSDILRRLEKAFETLYSLRYGSARYVWTFSRDRPTMRRLVKLLGEAEVEYRMSVYLKSDERFYVKARHPFPLFASVINGLADRPRSVMPEEWNCPHTPHCPHRIACAVVSARQTPLRQDGLILEDLDDKESVF